MGPLTSAGIAVVLNGVPRSGKSTVAAALANMIEGDWVNLGVDSVMATTPTDRLPGIGLRPGGERPDLEQFVLDGYCDLFDEIAARCRAGDNVVVDVGIHDGYVRSLNIWNEMHERLGDLVLLTVGVHCSLNVLAERRRSTGYLSWSDGEDVPEPVQRWQRAVHAAKAYDLEVDTTHMSANECAIAIAAHLERPVDGA